MKIEVKDHDNLREFLKRFPGDANKQTVKDLQKAGNDLRNNVILAMRNTPRLIGTAYQRTKSGTVHHPSMPGFAPAVDSGNYVKSIHADKLRGGAHVWVAGVPYLKYLEEGTNNMAARPVWDKQVKALNLGEMVTASIEGLIKET